MSFVSKNIPIDEINIKDERFQFRFQTRSEDLRASIADHGLLSPVTLWKPRKNSRYLIVDGFRRIDASIALGLDAVDAVIVNCTENVAYQRAYLENVVRKNLTPLEKATGICSVIDRIGKLKASEQLGISTKQLGRYVELLEAPSLTKQALSDGTISMAHALVISEYLPGAKLDEREMIRLAGATSAAELRKQLKKERKKGRPRKYTRIDADVLRVYAFRFNRDTATANDRQKVTRALKAALDFVES